MVLIHFNLKNPIMVGSKKHDNVQFYTEVVEASEQVDASRRSMYDPDEMDQEQRERQLRKRLNEAFKDFCKKVENTMNKAGSKKEVRGGSEEKKKTKRLRRGIGRRSDEDLRRAQGGEATKTATGTRRRGDEALRMLHPSLSS